MKSMILVRCLMDIEHGTETRTRIHRQTVWVKTKPKLKNSLKALHGVENKSNSKHKYE